MSITERFMAKVEMDPNSGCWLWSGSCLPSGYGRIKASGSRHSVYAHRLSYEMHVGPIPQGMFVCHACDTPSCVNPSHLWVGTCADNHADKVAKGRQPRGEANYCAKLTEAQARYALASSESVRQLAPVFGVSRACIHNLRAGRSWQSLHDKRSLSQLATEELAA